MEHAGSAIVKELAGICGPASKGLLGQCESILEQAFAAAFIAGGFKVEPQGRWWDVSFAKARVRLKAQHQIKVSEDPWAKDDRDVTFARADFAFYDGEKCLLLVEIDGHSYHEKDIRRAAADKSRDRKLLRCGYRVARFTGSEVQHGAISCANEAFALAIQLAGK